MIYFDRSCNICGYDRFDPLGDRADGVQVIVCQRCHHGVVRSFREKAAEIYDDSYFQQESGGIGYSDYNYTAEHSVSWAAALIHLLRTGGRVLDVGCADGHLLRKLGTSYEAYGVEPNARMAEQCRSAGFPVIAADVLDSRLNESFPGAFDIVVAIAVFEHIPDFREAISRSLALLQPEGLLLFEVPLLSSGNPDDPWLSTSLEHIHYPTEDSLHYLFEKEIQTKLAGSKVVIRNYADTFVGLASKSASALQFAEEIFRYCLETPPAELKGGEARFRWLLDVLHAGNTDPATISIGSCLEPSDFNRNLIRRMLSLWSVDASAAQAEKALADYLRQVEQARDWHAAQSSGKDLEIERLNAVVENELRMVKALEQTRDSLTKEVMAAQQKLEAIVPQLQAEIAQGQVEIARFRAEVGRLHAEIAHGRVESLKFQEEKGRLCAEIVRIQGELMQLRSSWSWRLTKPLRMVASFLRS